MAVVSQSCDHVVNDRSARSDTDRWTVDEMGHERPITKLVAEKSAFASSGHSSSGYHGRD